MIDNLTIRVGKELPQPVGSNVKWIKNFIHHGQLRDEYHLINKYNDHFLVVRDYGEYFKIEQSWRKWYLGGSSIEDLTYTEIATACGLIAKDLKVKKSDIAYAQLIFVEFGLTITLSEGDCFSLLEKIEEFSTLTPNRWGKGNSMTFVGQDYNLKFYDKVKEMIHKNRSLKKVLTAKNKLRIELVGKDSKGTQAKLHNIKSISDLLLKYKQLVLTLRKEVKKMKMRPLDDKSDVISFQGKGIADLREYLQYKGIISIGVGQLNKFIAEMGYNPQVKSAKKSGFRKLMTRHNTLRQYGKEKFMKDVTKQLLKVLQDKSIDLELL